MRGHTEPALRPPRLGPDAREQRRGNPADPGKHHRCAQATACGAPATRGSGSSVQDVNRLLKQFVQMRKMLKMVGGASGGGGSIG